MDAFDQIVNATPSEIAAYNEWRTDHDMMGESLGFSWAAFKVATNEPESRMSKLRSFLRR